MSRIKVSLLFVMILVGAAAVVHFGDVPESKAQSGVPGLQDRLEKGLKARRPVEFEFIGKVVAAVESGRLPVQLVDRTFFWARQHSRERPFQHFQLALTAQAKRLGIPL